ncbi:MAG: hypothetical protein ACPGXK_10915 [Phycisphaerae bacterium]
MNANQSKTASAVRTSRSSLFGLVVALGITATLLTACKDRPHTPSIPVELADNMALLPAGNTWYDVPYSRSATAEWKGFRDPSDTSASESTGGGGTEAQVRAFLEEYNEIAMSKDYEELLLYHVESQQSFFKPIFDQSVVAQEKLDALLAALEEKVPDKAAGLAEKFKAIEKSMAQQQVMQNFQEVSPTEATATLVQGPMAWQCKFVQVDGEWSLEFLDTALLQQLQAQATGFIAVFDQMIPAIESGAIDAEVMTQQLDMVIAGLETMQGASGGNDG